MRRTATLSIGLLAAAAVGLAPAISAAPAPPPAAKTRAQQVRPFPEVAFYRGTRTTSAEAVEQAGACALVGGFLLCFDTEAQARAAGSFAVRRHTTRRHRGEGVPAERCDPPAALYAAPGFDTSGGQRVLLLYDRGYWQSLVGSPFQFAGQTSSWKTGCAGGYISIKGAGGAPKLGMPTGGEQATMPQGWDDRAAAVRRCPC